MATILSVPSGLISKFSKFIPTHKKERNFTRISYPIQMDKLNQDQLKVFHLVEDAINKHQRLNLIVHGIAGTGKSFVLNSVRSLIEAELGHEAVLVIAPTGVAATHINGQTIHSAMKIPIDFRTAVNLDEDALEVERVGLMMEGASAEAKLKRLEAKAESATEFKTKLAQVRFLILDEFSMLSLQLLGYMDKVMRDVGLPSFVFGGVSLIFFGDLGQLPPVSGTRLFAQPPIGDELARAGAIAYASFNKVVLLEKVVRQIGPEQETFRNLLINIRNGTVTAEQIEILNTRVLDRLSEEEQEMFNGVTHIYPFNLEVDAYNLKEVQKLSTPIVKIQLFNGDKPECTLLAPGCKIVLLVNLWTEAALVNGARGIVDSICYGPGEGPPLLPAYVNIRFENYHGPLLENSTCVPIFPMYMLCRIKSDRPPFKELPIRLFYSCTVHKAQSQTLDRIVVDFTKTLRPAHALVFVALSRVRTINDFALVSPLSLGQLRATHDIGLQMMLQEEARLRTMAV